MRVTGTAAVDSQPVADADLNIIPAAGHGVKGRTDACGRFVLRSSCRATVEAGGSHDLTFDLDSAAAAATKLRR